jgi:D-lactate dehydrogenase
MRVSVFSTRTYDRESLEQANADGAHELRFLAARLDAASAPLAAGSAAACLFVDDQADAAALEALAGGGVRLLALRSAGYNHVDLVAARRLGIAVARVPAYSPHSIAEHAIGLMLMLNRRLHRAYNRVREGNFTLDGLLGFEMRGKTAGVVGTGGTGACAARILRGFGCRLLGYDLKPDEQLQREGVEYVGLDRLLADSHIITLHVPLNQATLHMIDARAVAAMRPGVMLINTSRGAVIDTLAVIDGIKGGRIGALGIDVYERESGVFFADHSGSVLADDVLSRLLTFPNVVVTGHQAFLTAEALAEIGRVTIANIAAFGRGERSGNEVS